MNRYKQMLADLGEGATEIDIAELTVLADQEGMTYDLGQAMISGWNFAAANPNANDKVLGVLIRAGLRREAIGLVSEADFPGKERWLQTLNLLLPTELDRGDRKR